LQTSRFFSADNPAFSVVEWYQIDVMRLAPHHRWELLNQEAPSPLNPLNTEVLVMPSASIPCRPESVVAPSEQAQFLEIYEEFYSAQNCTASYLTVPSASLYVEQFERVKASRSLQTVPVAENNRFDVSKYLTRSRAEWETLQDIVTRSRQREAERLYLSRQARRSAAAQFLRKLRKAFNQVELFFSLVRCEFQMAHAVLSR
jgi:hypothetical protein